MGAVFCFLLFLAAVALCLLEGWSLIAAIWAGILFFGLLGLCGFTDMRDVHKEIENGNKKAELALNMLVRSIKKTLGAYFFLLGGKVDALVFTAGIGENDDIVRAKVCEGLEELGVRLNLEENGTRKPGARTISTPDSKIKVLIIPTNEELQIAQATMEVLA